MDDGDRPAIVRDRNGRVKGTQKQRANAWTATVRRRFLVELSMTSNVRASARKAGKCEQSAYQLRARDSGFKRAWDEALSEGYAKLETVLLERAMHGTEKPVWNRTGEQIGKIREYSDRLALSLMAQHRETVTRVRIEEGAPPPADVDALRKALMTKFDDIQARLEGGEESEEG